MADNLGGNQGDRDAKGRFLPGNAASRVNGLKGGRPRTEDQEKLRAGLSKVVGNGSVNKWAEAIKRRFERGDMVVTEFVFARIIGKVPDNIEISGRLEHLLGAWASGDISDTDPTENSE